MKSEKILIVEDEQDIRQLMLLHLERKGYSVFSAVDGAKAYDQLGKDSFDLIILDWMLPGMSGLEILLWIRSKNKKNSATPVLFVTAKSEPENIVKALQSGADDYLIKPFDVRVLMARVSSLLRRLKMKEVFGESNNQTLSIGDIALDKNSHKVYIKKEEVQLTLSEFLLLETLLKSQGKVLSREQIAQNIQGEGVTVTRRTIDTHTSILRKKIGECGKMIETVRGVGYRIGYVK